MDARAVIDSMRQQGYSNPAQGIVAARVRAFLAGNDPIEPPSEPDRLAAVVTAMTPAVACGRVSQARLREAFRPMLGLKVRLGSLALP